MGAVIARPRFTMMLTVTDSSAIGGKIRVFCNGQLDGGITQSRQERQVSLCTLRLCVFASLREHIFFQDHLDQYKIRVFPR